MSSLMLGTYLFAVYHNGDTVSFVKRDALISKIKHIAN